MKIAKSLRFGIAFGFTMALAGWLGSQDAAARDPMKVEGTTSINQRVLTRPNALLFSAPEETVIDRPSTFSTFYVFDRKDAGGTEWLEVGPNVDGQTTQWIKGEDTVDWRQTIVLSFANPAGRIPVLFFEDKDKLVSLLSDETMSTRAELLAESARSGDSLAGTGVIAAEPEEAVDLTEQFYILPAFETERVFVNRRKRTIVRTASVNLDPQDARPAELGPFHVGIVFVIDTSTSMGPYIERTKQAIGRVLDGLEGGAEDDQLSFGIVGFRSSTIEVPELEYTARTFHPLKPEFDKEAFLADLASVQATTVSSHNFDEDGLSGLLEAVDQSNWDSFDGRYIIYISDAGMLVGEAAGSSSGTNPTQLGIGMRDKGIAPYALFLETRAGRAYHDEARAQLDSMLQATQFENLQVLPVPDGEVAAFGRSVDSLVTSLSTQISTMMDERAANAGTICDQDPNSIECSAASVGNAMRLAWLGRQQGTSAPDTYEAWAADFALDDPRRAALNVRVLLTRNQLNDLYVTLQAILEAADQSLDADPVVFFQKLKTILANAMRDPSQLQALDPSAGGRAANLGEFEDLGDLLGEYFTNLPYESDLASVTPSLWAELGPARRREMLETIRHKLKMYELYYGDRDQWVSLNDAASEGEKVYPMPLEMMP
ncbi:MAG: vWA domain-containing protein [Pseudomonadota bacterium]|nr:vWA domain-containing protein [Pseudomonadota bacterium]